MKVTYWTGHERSRPHWCRTRSRSSGRALASAISATRSPVSRTIRTIVAPRMTSVTTLERTRRTTNRATGSVLHLQVFPRIGVPGRDRGEDVLPLLRHHVRPDPVDERVPEHRHQVVVLE